MASVQKRGNTYIIRVSLGYDGNGRQIQKFMTWKPSSGMSEKQIEKELERQKVLFEDKCRTGQFLDGSIRFADFAEYWMKEYAVKNLRPTTVARYRDLLGRILPAIGHIRLDRLQPHHLMELYADLQADGARRGGKFTGIADFSGYLQNEGLSRAAFARKAGVSGQVIAALVSGEHVSRESAQKISAAMGKPLEKTFRAVEGSAKPLSGKTVLHHHRLISSILEKAVKWQVIFSNPCERVEVPKVERKEAKYLDEKQAAELLRCLENEPLQYRTIITLLLYSGMRRGELCGLEWGDIDFRENLIDINKSSLYLAEKGIFEDGTKNFSSKRVIKLPAPIMLLLAEHKKEQATERFKIGDKWEDSNKIFTQWNGKPIHPDTISGWFRKFIAKYHLPDVSIHSLRHTNATLLIAGGTDLRTVSKRLGHSNMTTTGNIYTHAIQTADERAAEVLGNMLDITPPAKKAGK